jgi:integrase
MSKRENFTVDRVAGFKCQAGKRQTIFWDGKTPGLGLRVTPAGAKSYIFETKLHGRTLRTTIGDARTWTIREAQDEATSLKAITDKGVDPRRLRAEQQAEAERARSDAKRRAMLVSDAWGDYVKARSGTWGDRHRADHVALTQVGGDKAKKGDKRTMPGALAALLPLPLAQVDADRVKEWLSSEAAARPTQAALAFRLLRAFLNWCESTAAYCGIAAADACSSRVAKEALPRKSVKSDCLQREQLAGWFAAVRSIRNPVIAAYLQALLLTGARREELAGLTWGDVDFRWLSLTIRDKVEGERTVPLTPYVASLLSALPRRNVWVFSSPAAKSGRLQEPRIQHSRAVAIAGIPSLTLHGLRRSFSTLSEWVECPAGVVAQIMGHKPSATAERHYKVRPLDQLRMWHTKIETWVLEQAGIVCAAENPGLRVVDVA